MNDQPKPISEDADAEEQGDAVESREQATDTGPDAESQGAKSQGAEAQDAEASRAAEVAGVAEDRPLEERLAEAERRAEELHDQMLRAHAERDNMRKRTDKEIARARKYAIEAFATALLEIKDNLERGLTSAAADADADTDNASNAAADDHVLEGVRLTLKSFEQVFEQFGIIEVPAAGRPFDPEHHQAMSTVKTADHPPNTVVEVVQKGYLLNDRLLRPAMVIVAAAEK